MSNYNIDQTASPAQIAVHNKALVANVIDTVTFIGNRVNEVEIVSSGSADIFVTTDGSDPTLNGQHCYRLPAAALTMLEVAAATQTIKLLSSGTPTYSLQRS